MYSYLFGFPFSLPPLSKSWYMLHRDKTEADGETQLASTWATSPADCPIVLRKIMVKEEDIAGCKCVVKIPPITDLEFEKFVAAPRNPHQILVICVLSSENQSYSPFFEWSLEKMYVEMQHGRPSPCIQVSLIWYS